MIVPRQNGKGAVIEAIELYGLFVLGETILHSAHLFGTAREAFMRIKALIEQTPDLRKRVVSIMTGNGKESIEIGEQKEVKDRHGNVTQPYLPPGRLFFHARSKGGGRGMSPQRVVLDEAFSLTPDNMAALVPALSAQDDPQINAFSTPPPVGEPCEVLIHARKQVLDGLAAGRPAEVAWLEWSVERGSDITDPVIWAAANPAIGIRISQRSIRDELDALGPDEFSVERLGIWPLMGDAQWLVIPEQAWIDAKYDAPDRTERDGRPAFALDMAPDRSWSAIFAAWNRPDGTRQVEVIDRRPGTSWIVKKALDLRKHDPCAWVVTRDSPAASEIPALEDAGVTDEVIRLGGPDLVAGSGLLFDGVSTVTVRHSGQPDLDAAVAATAKRPPTDKAWSFDRARPGSYLLLGVTAALWGLAVHGNEPPSVEPWFDYL